MESGVKIGRPKKSESEKRSIKQNFRLNANEDKILRKVPCKTKTAKWCYLLMFWDKRKSI